MDKNFQTNLKHFCKWCSNASTEIALNRKWIKDNTTEDIQQSANRFFYSSGWIFLRGRNFPVLLLTSHTPLKGQDCNRQLQECTAENYSGQKFFPQSVLPFLLHLCPHIHAQQLHHRKAILSAKSRKRNPKLKRITFFSSRSSFNLRTHGWVQTRIKWW